MRYNIKQKCWIKFYKQLFKWRAELKRDIKTKEENLKSK